MVARRHVSPVSKRVSEYTPGYIIIQRKNSGTGLNPLSVSIGARFYIKILEVSHAGA